MGSFNQIDWENHWRIEGINKFLKDQQKLRDTGNTESLAAGQRILARFVETATVALAKKVEARGKKPIEVDILRHFRLDAAILIAMRSVMRQSSTKQLTDTSWSTVAHKVGGEIENEALAITLYQSEEALSKHFDNLYLKFNRKVKTRGRASKRQALKQIAVKHFSWQDWGRQQRGLVGALLLAVLEHVGFIETTLTNFQNGKRKKLIFLSDKIETFITDYTENLSWLFSSTMPMIETPVTRVSTIEGGFYSKEMSSLTPLVKRRKRELKDTVVPRVNDAINKAQSVPYTVNTQVYQVVIELMQKDIAPSFPPVPDPVVFPLDNYDKATASPDEQAIVKEYAISKADYETSKSSTQGKRLSFKAAVDVARELLNQKTRLGVDKFWYTWTVDFRGRLYPATVALSPQGADIDKSLLLFYKGKTLGSRGERWLAIHGANVYGNDKVSLDDRYKWVLDNEEFILNVAEYPIDTVQDWGIADKPYQFLAFCFEWANYRREGQGYKSRLPIAVDGSCNGIQNYSAMLRDPVGAKATNLTDSELPADIYGEVAKVLEGKLLGIVERGEDDNGYATMWLSHGINRKLTKRQVMTLPYGSTMFSCKDYTYQYAKEYATDLFSTPGEAIKPSAWLSKLLWESIGEVVVKGREAMDWLTKCASVVAKTGQDLVFYTPLGLPVIFSYRERSAIEVTTRFEGIQHKLRTGEYNDTPNIHKTRNAIAPNFVHAMDATHLMMTLTTFQHDMLPVHDSYATHACDVDELGHVVRSEFYNLYTDYDPLLQLKQDLEELSGEELPPPPDKGDFNLKEVLRSTYFFS